MNGWSRTHPDGTPVYGRPHAESVQRTLDYWAKKNAADDAAKLARDAAMLRILRGTKR